MLLKSIVRQVIQMAKVIKCSSTICDFNSDKQCILDEITMDSSGYCMDFFSGDLEDIFSYTDEEDKG